MIKKLFALTALVATIGSVNVFAFDDVSTDYSYYKQINTLTEKGIIDGYDDNTFRPQNLITRGEFAKIFCSALNITECTGKAFPDVPSDSWMMRYVDALCSSGIIDGFEDGTFRPNENIRFKDAVKMVVCAQGFNEKAENRGGYPHGYMVVASAHGYTSDISADNEQELTREQAAVLLYNAAMNIPLYQLERRVYGDYYNGYVHVGDYPQVWQGIPNDRGLYDVKSNVFRKALPYEVKYTTDGTTYHTTIKSDETTYEWYDLPEDKPYIKNYSFDLVTGAFTALGEDLDIIAYSYDLDTWYDGVPKEINKTDKMPEIKNLPFDSEKEKVIIKSPDSDVVMIMEISDVIYADPTYYTVNYVTRIAYRIYVSRDMTNWTQVLLPDNALYATDIYPNADNKSFVVSCEVQLNDEDKQYVAELEKEAAEVGKIYDKPVSKTENYMIPFDSIK